MFAITVWTIQDGKRADIAYYERVATAPAMEDTVTRLHREYPAPYFLVDVVRQPVWT